MSKATLLADLRTILRYFKNLPSNGDNSFKTFAMRQFRSNVAISDKGEARNLRWKAHDAAQLVKGLRDRKELLDAYAGEKLTQEERIKLTAQRVGLNTPELYNEEEERNGRPGDQRSEQSGA